MTTRETYNEELNILHNDLIRMTSFVSEQIDKCIEALVNQDITLANKIIDDDDIVDKMEIEIESKCVKLIAKQQPIATDLRKIVTAIKIVTDIERIADHAVDISKIAIRLKDEEYIKQLIDIPRMAEIIKEMINGCLNAYINLDADLAIEISKRDDEIDAIYKQVFRELLIIMIENPKTITQSTQFLFVCKFLERIADHITNICEWVLYLITGEHKDLNS